MGSFLSSLPLSLPPGLVYSTPPRHLTRVDIKPTHPEPLSWRCRSYSKREIVNQKIFETIYYGAVKKSMEISKSISFTVSRKAVDY